MGAKLLQDVRQDLADVVQVCEGRKKQTNYLRTLINELVKGGQQGAPGSSAGQLSTHPNPPGPTLPGPGSCCLTEHLPGPCLSFRSPQRSRTEGEGRAGPQASHPATLSVKGFLQLWFLRTLVLPQLTPPGGLWSRHGGAPGTGGGGAHTGSASARRRGCGR